MKKEAPVCKELCVHTDRLSHVNAAMPPVEHIYELAELFSVFGDSTRMRILFALSADELCVCDLSEALGMTVSAISHQLKVLRQAKLVKSRREGKSVFYSLSDGHVQTILRQGMEHIEE